MMMKRIVSLLLALSMLFGMTGTALAADTTPQMYDKPIDLTLNETELYLVKGDEAQLTYTLTEDLSPSDIVWSSSDDSIATVDENGIVGGIKCGDVEITAQAGTSRVKCVVHVVGLIYSWENGARQWPIFNPIKRMMVNGGEVVSVDSSKPLYPVVYLDKAQTAPDAELSVYLDLNADSGLDRPTYYYADGLLIMDKVSVYNYDGTNEHKVSLQNGIAYEEIYGIAVGHNSYTWLITYQSVLLTLDQDELVLNTGESAVLSATVEGVNKPVVLWESSDESVATVDENGNVTAVGTGLAVISAIESESGYTETCEITVGETTSLNLNKTELAIERGSSEMLDASFTGTAPENAEFVWFSSDETIVTVEDGVVTGLRTGEAVVTVTCGEYEASCTVTVTGDAITDIITINRNSLILGKDQSAELTAIIPEEIAQSPCFVWSSSDRAVARVVDGVVTGFDYGTAVITASYDDYEASCEVTVAPVLYSEDNLTIVLQEPEGKDTVLFVDDSDEMNPIAYLNYEIESENDIPALECLGVENVDVSEVVVDAEVATQSIMIGERIWTITYKTSALILEQDEMNLVEGHGAPIKVYNNGTDDSSITWNSSNEAVAVVYDGVVTGVGAGTATISIQAGDYEATCTVNVTPNTNTTGIYTVETSAGSVAAKPGDTIAVPFVIESHDLPELIKTCIFYVKTNYAGLVYKGITISDAAQRYNITASVDRNDVSENAYKVYVGSSMPIYSLPEGVLLYMNFEVSEDAKSGVYNYHLNPVQFRSTDVNVAGNYRDYITAINNNLNCLETSGNVIVVSGEEEINAFARFSFEDTTCRGDENAVVSVSVSHDVEANVKSVQLVPQYDTSVMTLISAEAGSDLSDAEVTLADGVVTISNESGFVLPQGAFLKLTFELIEKVKDGICSVGIDTTDQVNNHIVDVDGSSSYGIAQFSGSLEITNYYTIFLTSGENGEISSDKMEAVEGETITLTAQAKEGYRLNKVVVSDAEGNAVTVTNGTFVMPASAVTVQAEFVEQKTMDIRFSVIGGTRPYYAIQFGDYYGTPSESYGEYNGAEYMYWVYPEDRSVPEGSTILEVVYSVLDEYDIEYGTSGSNHWVKAPQILASVRGGWILQNEAYGATTDPTTVIGPNAAWCVTIIRDGKYLEFVDTMYVSDIEQLGKFGQEEVLPGDEVIFHFSYDQFFEPSNSVGVKQHHDDYMQQYLKVKDFSPEQIAKIWTVEDLIDSIGTVNRSSEEKILAAENAYNALKRVEQSEVENSSVLKEARKRYDNLYQNNLMSPPILNAEDAEEVSDKESMMASITLASPNASVDDRTAKVQYRISSNKGASWSNWQDSPVFDELKAGTTYYFQAQYAGSELYGDSGAGNTIKVIAPYVVRNRSEWLAAFSAAPTDGTRTIIQIAGDVEVGVTGAYTTRTPIGANIIMIGDGGSLKSSGGGMTNNGFAVAENATVTLKNLTYESIGSIGATQYGAENANFGSMIYFEGKNGTVNLDNVIMYGDCSETGAIITCNASNCTLNIYSATIDNISTSAQRPSVGKLSEDSGLVINLLPTGNIALEGTIDNTVRLIRQKGYEIKGAAIERTTFRAFDNLEKDLQAMNAATETVPYVFTSTIGGLRVIVDNTPAIPKKLTAPEVDVDDLIIEHGKVTVPSDLVSKEQPQAILQYRIMVYRGDTIGWGVTAALGKWRCPPMTFTSELMEDTEYRLEIRFNSIDSNYANSDTTVVHFRTGYHTTQLTAPHLTNEAQSTDSSITLVQPVASHQDTGATFEYRVSENPENWEDAQWQKELVFENLKFGTTYYFQARYVANHYLWTDSEGSEAVEISTKAKEMAAPVLKETADTTIDSVALTKPVASAEDEKAALQYRISDDGIYWYKDWQDASVFEGLESNTDYYFQARYVPQNSRYLPSEGSNVVKVVTAVNENEAGFVVTGGTVRKGDTVEVLVSVRNNPGIISATLEVDYDSNKLELQNISNGDVFNTDDAFDMDFNANPYKLYFKNADNITTNGTMAKLIFKVKEGAIIGESEITLSYNPNNVFNGDFDNVSFDIVNGSVTIVDTMMGDANCDGVVDGKDVTTLYRYLAGWSGYELDEMDLAVADVTGDSKVNAKDASYLQRTLTGWDGYSLQ